MGIVAGWRPAADAWFRRRSEAPTHSQCAPCVTSRRRSVGPLRAGRRARRVLRIARPGSIAGRTIRPADGAPVGVWHHPDAFAELRASGTIAPKTAAVPAIVAGTMRHDPTIRSRSSSSPRPQPRSAAQSSPVATWRAQHERQIVDELMQLVAIPNVAGNDADMRRTPSTSPALFEKRGFTVERTDGTGLAGRVRLARRAVAARRPSTLYIHYDGQPVDASEWTRCKPFAPCLYGADRRSARCRRDTPFDPDWRRLRPLRLRRQGPDRRGAERGGGAAATGDGPGLEPARRARRRGGSRLGQLPPLRGGAARRAEGRPGDHARRPAPSERPADDVLRRARRRRRHRSPSTARAATCTPATTATGRPTRRCAWRACSRA